MPDNAAVGFWVCLRGGAQWLITPLLASGFAAFYQII
jgi:hypothetical protein